jgi:hypothetical protein
MVRRHLLELIGTWVPEPLGSPPNSSTAIEAAQDDV